MKSVNNTEQQIASSINLEYVLPSQPIFQVVDPWRRTWSNCSAEVEVEELRTDRNQQVAVVAPMAEAGESRRDRSVRVPWELEELANRKD